MVAQHICGQDSMLSLKSICNGKIMTPVEKIKNGWQIQFTNGRYSEVSERRYMRVVFICSQICILFGKITDYKHAKF